MKVMRFEDLLFWQKSRELTKQVYAHTRTDGFRTDFGMRDQIRRSCVSVMSNIAEGFGRGTNREMLQFLFIARGSLSEVKSQSYIAQDLGYVTDIDVKKLHEIIEEISRLMNAFINRIKNAPSRGKKND